MSGFSRWLVNNRELKNEELESAETPVDPSPNESAKPVQPEPATFARWAVSERGSRILAQKKAASDWNAYGADYESWINDVNAFGKSASNQTQSWKDAGTASALVAQNRESAAALKTRGQGIYNFFTNYADDIDASNGAGTAQRVLDSITSAQKGIDDTQSYVDYVTQSWATAPDAETYANYQSWAQNPRSVEEIEKDIGAASEKADALKTEKARYDELKRYSDIGYGTWASWGNSPDPGARALYAQNMAEREQLFHEADAKDKEYENAQKALKLLNEERQYSEFFKWNRLRENDDFAEKSKYVSTANGKEPVTYVDFDSGTLLYEESGYDDIYYDYINGVEDAVKKVDAEDGTFHTSHHGWRNLPKDVIKLYNYVYATQGKEQAREYIDYATTREYTGLEAMMFSFFDASGLNSATKTVEGLEYALTGNEERKESNRKSREDWERESKEAAAQYPGLYSATNMAVEIGKMALIGGAVGKIPAIANLAPAARAAATGAATFGLSTALDEAGDAVTGKIKPGDYAFDVLTSTAAGGAGGALSGAAGRFASDFLLSHGLAGNQVARAAIAGLPGLASAAGRTAVTETASFVRDPENYNVNWDALAQRAVVAYAFGVLGYIANNAGGKVESLAETGTSETEGGRPESEYFKDCRTLEELNAKRRLYAKEYADVYNSQSPDPERQNIVKSINSDYDRQANWFKQQAPEVFERAQEAYQNGDAEEARAETGELMVILESIQEDVNTGILQADGAQEALDALSSIVGDMRAATATQSGNDGEGKLLLTDAKPKNDSQTQDRVQELQRRYREAIDAGEKNTVSEAETVSMRTLLNESEEQKATRLSGAEITVTESTQDNSKEFSPVKNVKLKISEAKKLLLPVLEKLGISPSQYGNSALDIEFQYSRSGAGRSVAHQFSETNGDYVDFTKVQSNLKELCQNAYPLEAHYDEKPKTADNHVTGVVTLASVLRTSEGVVPVRMTVKFYDNTNPRLHVVINQAISESGSTFIHDEWTQSAHISTENAPATMTITDYFKLVNGSEEFTKRM